MIITKNISAIAIREGA